MRAARYAYTAEEREEMRELGLLGADFEQFYVIREFASMLDGADTPEGDYLLALFQNAARQDADAFENDPYLRGVKVPETVSGRFRLHYAEYARGEIFQYDMPDLHARLVVPKLGFFSRPVRFPALYEGSIPWVSVCPSEIHSMEKHIRAAHGNVLVLGLGLGYYVYRILGAEAVRSVTVVELSEDVTKLFCEHLMPQFPHTERLRVVCADALAYLPTVKEGQFDFCFADIWEGVTDGAPLYEKIRVHEHRLPGTRFAYWIEEQIKDRLALSRK